MRNTPIFLKGLRKNCLFLRGWDCDGAFDLFLFLGLKVSLPHPYGGGVWLLNGKAPVRVVPIVA